MKARRCGRYIPSAITPIVSGTAQPRSMVSLDVRHAGEITRFMAFLASSHAPHGMSCDWGLGPIDAGYRCADVAVMRTSEFTIYGALSFPGTNPDGISRCFYVSTRRKTVRRSILRPTNRLFSLVWESQRDSRLDILSEPCVGTHALLADVWRTDLEIDKVWSAPPRNETLNSPVPAIRSYRRSSCAVG